MEEVSVFLPELFRVNGAPFEAALADFFLELFDRAEDFVVLVDVLVELVQEVVYFLVHPVSVLQLCENVQSVYISHQLQTRLVRLQVLFTYLELFEVTSNKRRMIRTIFSLLK